MKKALYVIAPVIALFVSVAVVPTRASATTASAAECTVTAVGAKNTAGNVDSRFTLNGDGTVSATFEVKGDDACKQSVVLASWQAPDGDKGRPYDQQKLYKYVSGTFPTGKHTLTVQLPDCYYQVDLVRGTAPTGPNDSPLYEKGRMLGSLHGGTKVCEQPKKTETLSAATTQPTPATMPTTGPANVLGIFAGTSAFGAAAHHVVMKRRVSRK